MKGTTSLGLATDPSDDAQRCVHEDAMRRHEAKAQLMRRRVMAGRRLREGDASPCDDGDADSSAALRSGLQTAVLAKPPVTDPSFSRTSV